MKGDELNKMDLSDGKRKIKILKKSPRNRSTSNYSVISLSEVTEGSLQIWRALPDKIRQDPSLASFRQEHERIHGEFSENISHYTFAHFYVYEKSYPPVAE